MEPREWNQAEWDRESRRRSRLAKVFLVCALIALITIVGLITFNYVNLAYQQGEPQRGGFAAPGRGLPEPVAPSENPGTRTTPSQPVNPPDPQPQRYQAQVRPSVSASDDDEPIIMTSNTVRDVVAQCGDAVVRISTKLKMPSMGQTPGFLDPFFREYNSDQSRTGLGSGFLFQSDGYILTNYHVVEGADEVSVYLTTSDAPYAAVVIGKASELDLAVIKIEGDDFPFLAFGDSDIVSVGDWVIAIGNPYGLDHTVTVGVISAMGRPLTIGGTVYQNLLQTDAAINRGNSGGPMLNLRGEVIGINTAINAAAQGIGFAIPSSTVLEVIDEMVSGVDRVRPWMGIHMQPLTREMMQYFNIEGLDSGVIIYGVIPDSPASKAGLSRGDALIEVDGQKVTDTAQIQGLILRRKVGDTIVVKVIRDSEILEFSVTLEASKLVE